MGRAECGAALCLFAPLIRFALSSRSVYSLRSSLVSTIRPAAAPWPLFRFFRRAGRTELNTSRGSIRLSFARRTAGESFIRQTKPSYY